ncbi:MAG: hypothetical protein GXO54_00410 [Chloroflexi bacterium]|nr:hypothetical protein [Chloroflexota bacterium]
MRGMVFYLGWIFLVSSLGAGCFSTSPFVRKTVKRNYQILPAAPLYVQSLAESQIAVVDIITAQVIGTLQDPKFRAAAAIEVDSQGYLFVAIDADATHDYREIWKIDPRLGTRVARIELPTWAPTLLAMSPQDILLVGHSLEKPDGSSDIDVILAREARRLQTLEVPGLAVSIAFGQSVAYVAINASRHPANSGVLVYDIDTTRGLRWRAYYRLTQPTGKPPLSPVSVAFDAKTGLLYMVLFQYDAQGPCQQHGRLVALDTSTGTWQRIIDLEDVGPVAVLSDGTLLIGEACPWGKGRLWRVDPIQKHRIQQMTFEPGVWTLHSLGNDIYAVGINPNPLPQDASAPRLFFVDGRQWRLLASIPLPLSSARDLAGSLGGSVQQPESTATLRSP